MATEADEQAQPRVGVLGDSRTFAGQAFSRLVELDATQRLAPAYGESLAALWERLDAGEIDALLITAETTTRGPIEGYQRVLEEPRGRYFVAGEVVVPYQCQLLGRPGTNVAALQRILGHGSLRECDAQLDRLAPRAARLVSPTNSVLAAREVLESDASTAVVGTRALACDLGLVTLAADVDGGSEGVWWLVTTALRTDEHPDRLVLRIELGEDRKAFSEVIRRAHEAGWHVRTLLSRPLATQVFEWECLVVLTLQGEAMDDVPELVEAKGVDMVGAFRANRSSPSSLAS